MCQMQISKSLKQVLNTQQTSWGAKCCAETLVLWCLIRSYGGGALHKVGWTPSWQTLVTLVSDSQPLWRGVTQAETTLVTLVTLVSHS